MRRGFMFGLGSLGVSAALVFALGAGPAAAKQSAKPKAKSNFSCTETYYNPSYPKTSGFAFAVLKCSNPFGDGVQYITFNESVTGKQVKQSGTVQNYFDDGTTNGTYSVSGTLSSGTTTTSGALTITGGTGTYKNAKGAGKLTCKTTDNGKTGTCTSTGTVTY